jgi:hypothetical protein
MFRKRHPQYNERNITKASNTAGGRMFKELCSFFKLKPLYKITLDDVLAYQARRLEHEARLEKVERETRRLYRLLRWADLRKQMYDIRDELGRGHWHWIEFRRRGWEYHRGNQVYTLAQGWHVWNPPSVSKPATPPLLTFQ